MADDIAITAGSGTTIATDEVSGPKHIQIVKLADGTADSATRIPGSAAGLYAQGGQAHDAVAASNPVITGAVAVAHGSNPAAVAVADAVQSIANRAGVPFHIGGHPNVKTFAQNYTTSQTNAAVISVSAGTKLVITAITVIADNAMSVSPAVRIGLGTSTVPAYGNNQIVASHPGLAGGAGINRGDGSGIIAIGADDEDLRITISATPTGGSIDVIVTYYTIES